MMSPQWDVAFDFAFEITAPLAKDLVAEGWLARTRASDEREVTRAAILDLIEVLFERKQVLMALAWSFLVADSARTEMIQAFLPQVEALLAKTISDDKVYTDSEAEILR
jgi:hypothetical protein